MSQHLCQLCILACILLASSAHAQESTTQRTDEGGEEIYTAPPEWDASPTPKDGNGNKLNAGKGEGGSQEGNSAGSGSNEGGHSKEIGNDVKVEAMYHDGYSWYDDSWHRRYDRYYRRNYWRENKWQDFIHNRRYINIHDIYGYAANRFWPRHDNRWDTPQEDEWNLRDSECNDVSRGSIPDSPYGYSDQAYNVPHWKLSTLASVKVSAFDIYKERCCQGSTYPKYPNGHYSCCGSSDYDTLREVCCDGRVFTQQAGYQCCGENYIDSNTEICCYHPEKGIVPKQLPSSAMKSAESHLFSQCCGEELYDTRSHVCFLVSSWGDDSANFTLVEKKYNHTGCCEGQPYDQDLDDCNETGKAYTFLSGPPCVFKQAYELMLKRNRSRDANINRPYYWSDYRPYWRPDYYSWRYDHRYNRLLHCGDQKYDPVYQSCCGDQYGENVNGTFKVWNDKRDHSCCGTELFNYHEEQCCGERVHKRAGYNIRCCGQEQYDPDEQWCCDGSRTIVKAQPEMGDSCCGTDGLIYNSSSHLCCRSRLVEIPESTGYRHWNRYWSCCIGNDVNRAVQAYDAENAKCCNGIVYNITYHQRWSHECCGDQLYDRHNAACCGGQIYQDKECCGNEAYDRATHRCCDNTISVKQSQYDNSCCGKIPYDHQLQTCCLDYETKEWHVTFKKSRYEECCQGKAFDPYKETCCGRSPSLIIDDKKSLCCGRYEPEKGEYTYAAVDKKPNANDSSCCGLSPYDMETEICCNETVLPDPFNNKTCCGSAAYNKDTQLCCLGQVYDRSNDDHIKCCGKKAYDTTKEICCHGVPFLVDDVNTALCCYDKQEEQDNWQSYYK